MKNQQEGFTGGFGNKQMKKGTKHTEDTKMKISLIQTGKHLSEEHKKKISNTRKKIMEERGYLNSPETRLRISETQKGRKLSKESIEKRTLSRKDYRHSEETKRKIGLGNEGKKISEETREKLSLIQIGKHNSPRTEFKKGQKTWNRGISPSEETRKKMSENSKGKIISEETRKKLSLSHKGKVRSKEHRKNLSIALKGKHLSEETKQKISQANKGEKSKFWQGGKSFEPYGLEFNKQLKEQIRKRDNYRCQECLRHQSELRTKTNKPYKLHIHHIDYKKKNNNPSNLISLCRGCHVQTNFKRDNWENYFKLSIQGRSE